MFGFTTALKEDRSRVNEALERGVSVLPASVRDIAAYVLLSGGKRIRPLLTLTCARLFGCREADLYDIATVPEMFHVATLLHDDILDDADTRRGQTSAHLRFGVSSCILAGDALLAEACRKLAAYNDPRLMTSFSRALLYTVGGEADEIAGVGALLPSMEHYLAVIEGKTGWLLRSACEIGALRAGASDEQVQKVASYGMYMGLAFQIVDDALDFADEAETGKPTGGDLRERKCTPPVMYYAESLSPAERADFAEKFASGAWEEEEFHRVCLAIRTEGAEKTRVLADSYLKKADACLGGLPMGIQKTLLHEALAFVRDRRA